MSKVTNKIRINVLAYNEADFIERCLNSIDQSLSTLSNTHAEISIICNGCLDDTYPVTQRYCQNKDGWQSFDIPLGDKANAWNYAIELGNDAPLLTIFIDGDCTITPGSLESIIQSYHNHPDCYIIAGIPKTQGRTTNETKIKTLNGEALSGNFYALTPCFMDKVYQLNFRLPIGLIGDDSLLAWVASHNFKLSNGFSHGFLRGCKGAEFYYHRLTPTSLKNIYQYIRRLHRYSLRHLQQSAIREHLNYYDSFESLPDSIDSIYSNIKFDHLRLKSPNSVFDMINYFKIKNSASIAT
ncbi:glycosyltransferase family A protein [Vibrio sp. DNB22_19_1]